MSNTRRAFDVDAKTRVIAEAEVTIDGTVYHPVPITPGEARKIKKLVRRIRRSARQAQAMDKRVEEAEQQAAQAPTQEETARHFAAADEWQAKVDEHEEETERLTHELLAAELVDEAGVHPDPTQVAAKVPGQLQGELFEFLAGATDEDPDDEDPQSPTSTASTSG